MTTEANNVDNVQCLHKVGTAISTHVVLNLEKHESSIDFYKVETTNSPDIIISIAGFL